MSNQEFKVGDRVKITSQTWGYRRRHHIGVIAVCEQRGTYSCPYKVIFDIPDEYDQYYMWFSDEDFELIK